MDAARAPHPTREGACAPLMQDVLTARCYLSQFKFRDKLKSVGVEVDSRPGGGISGPLNDKGGPEDPPLCFKGKREESAFPADQHHAAG